jgi:hypothetical protein
MWYLIYYGPMRRKKTKGGATRGVCGYIHIHSTLLALMVQKYKC